MTVLECINDAGIQMETDSIRMYQTVDIAFINSDGRDDETEFDVSFLGTRAGVSELRMLYANFCKDNGFPTDTVTSISVVKSADSFEELF